MWVLSTDTSAADVNSGYVFGNNNIKLRHQQRRERSNYYSTSDLWKRWTDSCVFMLS